MRTINILLFLLIDAGCVVEAQAAGSDRPNLVIFISDDHGYLDTSLAGADEYRTPNLERLAKAGMTLSHAFAISPSCAPSRAALLTGLTPMRNGAMLNHQPPRPEVKKLPAYLHDLDYEVVAFGKVAHYGQAKDFGFDLVSHDGFHQDECVSVAVDYLNERASNKPLCIMVGTNWPHVPWPSQAGHGDPASVHLPPTQVDTPETRQWRTRYAVAVNHFDRDLGRVYDAARKSFGDNMLFLHFSDHGAQWPFGKWNLYDAGTRVRCIAVRPGIILPHSRSDAMLDLTDVLPTLVETAGGSPPAGIDGQSFTAILSGKTLNHRQHIFTTHSGDGRMNRYPMRSVRTRDWKYIRNLRPDVPHSTHINLGKPADGSSYWQSWVAKAKYDPLAAGIVERYSGRPAEELYDLSNDPYEQHNLASKPQHGEILTQLRSKVDDWMQQQGDHGLSSEEANARQFLKPAAPKVAVPLVDPREGERQP